MHPAHLLVLLGVCVSLLGAASIPRPSLNIMLFGNMIQCTIPCEQSWLGYLDYGCYCGSGSSGIPVDDVDKCCKTHDECYYKAGQIPGCSVQPNEVFNVDYSYECNEGQLTCNESNNECEMAVCNCDRAAAICFARFPYNKNYWSINTEIHCR
uniref:Acidic phospholipase A2 homolog textilotoxin D chain n=1 Tax=Pseudonaja textilis TaxID=8673 RepID=PA2HD_PSETE|nr:RecName: Full=Acidic phospholipase A2 homolog textilotoxin D chain; Short=svPLA2 homolog; Flags: Precursor [Pseudonaja textilis]AAZ22644.1 textilotoxin D chain precursor [Pseudonaja textilis]